jgi:hypothetical protein
MPAIRLVLLLLALFVSVAEAADVDDLYSARVAVKDRSDSEFKRGMARALEAVFVKLTGSSEEARTKAARAIVGQASRLVQQFGYERPPASRGDSDGLVLRAEFDARVLTSEMRSRGLVVWGKERPDTLVWLIIDDGDGRQLLGSLDEHPVVEALRARAAARGIPVVLPLADITEAASIAGADTTAGMAAALGAISEKYGVRSVLVGHLQQVLPTLWESRWTLTVADESLAWDRQGDLAELLGEEAADTLADALGRRYASPAAPQGADRVALTVRNIGSPADYARTERYLRTLDSVAGLFVRRVDNNGIVFDLDVQGGALALRQGISFGQTLAPDPVEPGAYRLLPR